MTLLIVGLVITANFLAPLAIPALPEMMDAIKDKYPHSNLELAGNYAGGLFNAGLSLGQIIGPFFGAATYAALNFRLTEDIMALICITFSLMYFFFADGKLAISQTFRPRSANQGAEQSFSKSTELTKQASIGATELNTSQEAKASTPLV